MKKAVKILLVVCFLSWGIPLSFAGPGDSIAKELEETRKHFGEMKSSYRSHSKKSGRRRGRKGKRGHKGKRGRRGKSGNSFSFNDLFNCF